MDTNITQYISKHIREISALLAKEEIFPPFIQYVNGGVAVLDLSGYSILATRLLQLENKAAEILTRVMNTFFDQLITMVDSCGGDIVKFVGDALIVYWKPPSAFKLEEMVANVVLFLVQLLQDVGRYTVYVPELDFTQELITHIGFGYGSICHCHLGVGKERWEHVMTGEAVSDACANLAAAGPGELVLDAKIWDAIGDRLQGKLEQERRGNFLVVKSFKKGKNVSFKKIQLTVHSSDVPICLRYLNESFRYWLGRGHSSPTNQLRNVTVLFSRVAGTKAQPTSTILEKSDLQKAFRTTHEIVKRFGGLLYSFNVDDKGAAALSVFGLPPTAHENNAVLALQSSMALGNHLGKMFHSFSIGVSTGKVFVGTIGNSLRKDYALVADVLNVAARLMSSAESNNGIVCDEETHALCLKSFVFSPLKKIKIKGKEQGITIYKPIHDLNAKTYETYTGEFIGRQAELKIITQALADFQESKHIALLIEGEPGDGKSKFAEFIMHEGLAKGFIVCLGRLAEVEKNTPYFLYRDIFSQLFCYIDENCIVGTIKGKRHHEPGSSTSVDSSSTNKNDGRDSSGTRGSRIQGFRYPRSHPHRHRRSSLGPPRNTAKDVSGNRRNSSAQSRHRFRRHAGIYKSESPPLLSTNQKQQSGMLEPSMPLSKDLMPKSTRSGSPVQETPRDDWEQKDKHPLASSGEIRSKPQIIGIDQLRQLSQLGRMNTVVGDDEDEEEETEWAHPTSGKYGVASSQVWGMEDDSLRATLLRASVKDYLAKASNQLPEEPWENALKSTDSFPVKSPLPSAQTNDAEMSNGAFIEGRVKRCLQFLGMDPTLAPLLNIIFQTIFQTSPMVGQIGRRVRSKLTRLLLLKILQAISTIKPIVLVLDDCHWQDSSSWELTAEVIRRCDRCFVCLLMLKQVDYTTSQHITALSNVQRIELKGLDPSQTKELALKLLGKDALVMSNSLAEKICLYTGGKPLFIENFIFGLREQGLLTIANNRVLLSERSLSAVEENDASMSRYGPQRNLILAFYDHLSPNLQSILRIAATIGQKFLLEDLFELMPDGTTLDELIINIKKLEEYGFLVTLKHHVQDGHLSFDCHLKSQIHKETIVSLIPNNTRQDIHAQLAEFYEKKLQETKDEGKYLPLVCYHYSATPQSAKKIRYWHMIAKMYTKHAHYEEASHAIRAILNTYQSATDNIRRQFSPSCRGEWHMIIGEAHLWEHELGLAHKELSEGLRLLGFTIPSTTFDVLSWIRRLMQITDPSTFLNKKPWVPFEQVDNETLKRTNFFCSMLQFTEGKKPAIFPPHRLNRPGTNDFGRIFSPDSTALTSDKTYGTELLEYSSQPDIAKVWINCLELLQYLFYYTKEQRDLLLVSLLLFHLYRCQRNMASVACQASIIATRLLGTSYRDKAHKFMLLAEQLTSQPSKKYEHSREFVQKMKSQYYFILGDWDVAIALFSTAPRTTMEMVSELCWDDWQMSAMTIEFCTGNYDSLVTRCIEVYDEAVRKGNMELQIFYAAKNAINFMLKGDMVRATSWANYVINFAVNLDAFPYEDLFRYHSIIGALLHRILQNLEGTKLHLFSCLPALKKKLNPSAFVLGPILTCSLTIFSLALEGQLSQAEIDRCSELLRYMIRVCSRLKYHCLGEPASCYCSAVYWVINNDTSLAINCIKRMLHCPIMEKAGVLKALGYHLMWEFLDTQRDVRYALGTRLADTASNYPTNESEYMYFNGVLNIFKGIHAAFGGKTIELGGRIYGGGFPEDTVILLDSEEHSTANAALLENLLESEM